ncbi:hypothetical protein Tel_15835 [Candidatus Tenderia electrophaga]|jgi:cytochrome c556|uniref:Cytochrome C n=1 Tax=Candidatus Tenderia electrophaga TaxID=1748243 RepID=A0A0S2TH79_9GAMM|nr:hypothetical protein Tel_15835 [Candidatus Tenderia electrophaga]
MLSKPMKALACAVLLLTGPAAQAEDVLVESGYTEIMQEMVGNMQDIVFGIMVEDYDQVAVLAEAIAFHPEPDMGRQMALLKKLGMDAKSFTLHEDRIRQNALRLQKAASARDPEAVIEKFAALAESCSACHAAYRERIRSLIKRR